jgi:hypothetical protein
MTNFNFAERKVIEGHSFVFDSESRECFGSLLRFAVGRCFDAALAGGVGQGIDQTSRIFPADTGVGDALAVDERFARNQILTARLEMAFDHDADDARVAGSDLRGNVLADSELLGRFLAAVAVASIDHDARRDPGFGETLGGGIDVGGVVVGLFAAAQNHVAVFVAGG